MTSGATQSKDVRGDDIELFTAEEYKILEDKQIKHLFTNKVY